MLISSHNAMKSRSCCGVACSCRWSICVSAKTTAVSAASYQVGNLEKEKLDQETCTMIFYRLLEIWK
jgi:hypothetical protein